MQEIDCLVPAAGRSERMGQWKLLLPFRGSTIIETVVANALRACSRALLVTGYRAAELAALFEKDPRVLAVNNAQWERGMFSSIQCGIGRVEAERFFIALGDMPFLQPEVYEALLQCPPADVVFPVHGGRRGHPVLFHRRIKDAVLRGDPSTGRMSEISSRFQVSEMQWGDDTIHRDIDTAKDYA